MLERFIVLDENLTCREILPLVVKEFKVNSDKDLNINDLCVVLVTNKGNYVLNIRCYGYYLTYPSNLYANVCLYELFILHTADCM